MDRKEYKEYFSKYYKTPFISVEQNNNGNVDERKRKVMDVAIKALSDWYDDYFNILFNKAAMKEMNDNTISKTIDTPFTRNVNLKLSREQAATIIINRYFDFIVMTNCPQYADGKTRKRIRKQAYNDFIKGRYFRNQIGEKLYKMIERIVEK